MTMQPHPPPLPIADLVLPDDAQLTYMSPEEFGAIGERIYGTGWQTKLSRIINRSRVQIHRYANGDAAIPPDIAILMRVYRDLLDRGERLPEARPVGYVAATGFTALDLPTIG